jgi:hypothetical protein
MVTAILESEHQLLLSLLFHLLIQKYPQFHNHFVAELCRTGPAATSAPVTDVMGRSRGQPDGMVVDLVDDFLQLLFV